MAPEAFDGKRNAQTDIWAVGVILYQLLTGNLPFPQRGMVELVGALARQDPAPLPASIPFDLQSIGKKALEKEISNRYQTADEIAQELRAFLQKNAEETLKTPVYEVPPTESLPIIDEPVTERFDSVVTRPKTFAETGKLIPFLKGAKFGFSDENKKLVIQPKYDWADSFSEGLARVNLNGKYGFIDKTGAEIIPFKYDGANSFSEGLASVKLNGKHGFIDKKGNKVVTLKYDNASSFSEGLARVGLNSKWFYIDKNNTEYYEP